MGAPPPWPLGRKPTKAQAEVWVDVWRTPQSVAWEELGYQRVVGRYVVALVLAEKPGAPASLLSEVRQLEDRLGLSPMAMLRLRWSIGKPDETGEEHDNAVASIDEYRQMLRSG